MLSGNFCAELAETNKKAENQLVNKWYFFPILCPYVITSSLTYAQASNFWNCDFMFSFEVLIIALKNHCVKSVQIRNYFIPNTGKCGTEITPYLDTLHAVNYRPKELHLHVIGSCICIWWLKRQINHQSKIDLSLIRFLLCDC